MSFEPCIEKEKASLLVEKLFDEQLIPGLSDFIRVPNLSPQFDPEWKTNGLLEKAA